MGKIQNLRVRVKKSKRKTTEYKSHVTVANTAANTIAMVTKLTWPFSYILADVKGHHLCSCLVTNYSCMMNATQIYEKMFQEDLKSD